MDFDAGDEGGVGAEEAGFERDFGARREVVEIEIVGVEETALGVEGGDCEVSALSGCGGSGFDFADDPDTVDAAAEVELGFPGDV